MPLPQAAPPSARLAAKASEIGFTFCDGALPRLHLMKSTQSSSSHSLSIRSEAEAHFLHRGVHGLRVFKGTPSLFLATASHDMPPHRTAPSRHWWCSVDAAEFRPWMKYCSQGNEEGGQCQTCRVVSATFCGFLDVTALNLSGYTGFRKMNPLYLEVLPCPPSIESLHSPR